MGFFELAMPGTSIVALTGPQLESIRRHIQLVRVTEKSPATFCAWVESVLDLAGAHPSDMLSLVLIRGLKDKFHHVIDKEHVEPNKARAAHGPCPKHTLITC